MTHGTVVPLILNTVSKSAAPIVPYTVAAFGTLLVYDWLCTLSDEVATIGLYPFLPWLTTLQVSLVWSQPGNIGSLLFFLNRYPPFIDTFLSLHSLTTLESPEVCLQNFKIVTWLIVFGVFIAELILMIRTYAIFERKRWMLALLSLLMAIVVIPGIVIVDIELNSLSYGFPKVGPYTGCFLTKAPSVVIIVAYLLVLFTETIIVGLTAFKAIQHLRRSRAPLVINLYRNGLVFYVYILLISLANVLVPIVGPSALANWLATPQRALHSIFCTRVLLSLLHDRKRVIAALNTSSRSQNAYRFTTLLPSSADTEFSAMTPSDPYSTDDYHDDVSIAQLDHSRQAGPEALELDDLHRRDEYHGGIWADNESERGMNAVETASQLSKGKQRDWKR
ncbi:hypothetical protein BDW22DRAFT_1346721 [Trametopsis cervina]|nr:hypothetical protein BDW22DRAFT_1346721 [Trametopsis cervina]